MKRTLETILYLIWHNYWIKPIHDSRYAMRQMAYRLLPFATISRNCLSRNRARWFNKTCLVEFLMKYQVSHYARHKWPIKSHTGLPNATVPMALSRTRGLNVSELSQDSRVARRQMAWGTLQYKRPCQKSCTWVYHCFSQGRFNQSDTCRYIS